MLYPKFFYCLLLMLLVSLQCVRAQTDLNLQTASYIGGAGDDEATAVAIRSDNQIVIAGKIDDLAANYSLTPHNLAVGTAIAGGKGVVLRFNDSGTTLLSISRLGNTNHVEHMAIHPTNDKIAVTGTFGFGLLNATGDAVLWSQSGGDIGHIGTTPIYSSGRRISMGTDGTVAALYNKDGNGLIYLYNEDGTPISSGLLNVPKTDIGGGTYNERYEDVAVDAANKLVFVTGTAQRCPNYQTAFVMAYSYDAADFGTQIWKNWTWWCSAALDHASADTRGIRVKMAENGNLLFTGYAHGGNNFLRKLPNDYTLPPIAEPNIVDIDTYTNFAGAQVPGYSSAFVARVNPADGSVIHGQFHHNRNTAGAKTTFTARAVAGDNLGNVIFGGNGAAHFINRNSLTVNAEPTGPYTGGEGYFVELSSNFTSREQLGVFTYDAPATELAASQIYDIAARGNRRVIIATTKGRLHTQASIQATITGGWNNESDMYFATWNTSNENADFIADSEIVCEGETVIFTDNSVGATDWNWTFAGATPATATGAGPHTVVYPTAGSYDVVLSINSGADTETKINFITVTNVGAVSLTASETDICDGEEVVFTADPADVGTYNFKVNGTTVQSGTSASLSTTTLADTDEVTVELITTCATLTSTAITMSVSAVPTAGLTASATTICPGDAITFTATPAGAAEYDFRINGTSVSIGIDDTFTTTALSEGDELTVRVTTTDPAPCNVATSVPTSITVNPTAISLTASATTVCEGTSVTFTATPAGLPSYTFTVGGTPNTTTTNTFTTTTLADGDNATVEITNACGTFTSTPIAMTINDCAAGGGDTGGGGTAGGGSSAPVGVEPVSNLTAIAESPYHIRLRWTGSPDATSYRLYRNEAGTTDWIYIVISSIGVRELLDEDLKPDTRYRYRLEAIREGQIAAAFVTEFTYPEVPIATLTRQACGEEATASVRIESTHLSRRILWYESPEAEEPFAESQSVFTTPMLSESTTYYITAQGQKYESAPRVPVQIQLISIPEIHFTSLSHLNRQYACSEEATISIEDQGEGVTYTWIRNNTPIDTTAIPSITVRESGSYIVIVNRGGCIARSRPIQVVLEYEPEANIETTTRRFCEQAVLSAREVQNATYEWFRDAESLGVSENSQITVNQSGSYRLKVRQYGCENTSESVNIEVLQLPSAIELSTTASAICPQQMFVLTTTDVEGAQYHWSRNGRSIGFSEINTLERSLPGIYQVRMSFQGLNCSVMSDELIIEPLKAPRIDIKAEGSELKIVSRDTALAIIEIRWFFGIEGERIELFEFENQIVMIPNQTGIYEALITYENGCPQASIGYRYFAESTPTANQPEQPTQNLRIYPNPTSDYLYIDGLPIVDADWQLSIYDALGRLVKETSVYKNSQTIDMQNLPKGTYMIRLTQAQFVFTVKCVKE
ncbi:MAG: T9SS type A sorting domain-containing protein [Bernardetiaceae bacterium]|nr:T9SS type A sorting domain-containing protein [Bernardetiaceae bacterium]